MNLLSRYLILDFLLLNYSHYSRGEEVQHTTKMLLLLNGLKMCGLIGLNNAYSYTLLMKMKKREHYAKIVVPWKLNQ